VSRFTPYALRLTHSVTLRVFLLALFAYSFSAQVWAHAVSLAPHYVYLAYALLHRHVDLIQLPPVTYDLLQHNGQWFVAGSPMPSLLMLPFVAIFGVGFSDVLFSVIVGALDVALVYSLLGIIVGQHNPVIARSAQHDEAISSDPEIASHPAGARNDASSLSISESARRWITLLFALGTPFWYLASLGTYWFTAHVVVVLFTLLATREALTKQRWFLVGLWLACAGFARPTALFLAPFFLIIMVYAPRTTHHAPRFAPYVLRSLALFTLALLIGIGAHFAYNYARFKSFTDFGYTYVEGASNITSVYARYGGFNPRFAPCNLAVSLFSPPEVNGVVPTFITQACAYLLEGVNLSDTAALITPNPLGMSIFLVTPALLIVFLSLRPAGDSNSRLKDSSADRRPAPTESNEPRPRRWTLSQWLNRRGFQPPALIVIAAWIGLLATLLPLWFYHNTGSLQFGWRYLFDATPMWIILLAAGMQKVTRLKQSLILVSITINLWGFLWMFEKLNGVSWWK
jgi:hypothetical protein